MAMFPIARIVWALVVGAVAWLICLAAGFILPVVGFPPLSAAGEFLAAYAVAIGVIVALLAFFRGAAAP